MLTTSQNNPSDLIPAAEVIAALGCSRSTYFRRGDIVKVKKPGSNRVYSPRWVLDQAKIRGRS